MALHHGEIKRCSICGERDTPHSVCAYCEVGLDIPWEALTKIWIWKLRLSGVSMEQAIADVIKEA